MFAKRKYLGAGDRHDIELKRDQFLDSNSSPYGLSAQPNLTYTSSHPYSGQPPPFPVVRVRGLPFDCVEADVAEFFHGLDILDILFVHKGGRLSGEAFCVLAHPVQVDYAVQKNRQNMGRRYIEVFRSNRQEYYSAVAHEAGDVKGGSPHRSAPGPRAKANVDGKEVEHTGVVRMRGLPYCAGKDDVLEFFTDFELSEDRVHITLNAGGRPRGEAFVEFANADDAKSAMEKDRKMLGTRYIELFPSSAKEMEGVIKKQKTKMRQIMV